MKISTKGRYALRLMLDLALSGRQDCVALKEIAVRQQISIKYMEQIITILNRGGFVHSLRGPPDPSAGRVYGGGDPAFDRRRPRAGRLS